MSVVVIIIFDIFNFVEFDIVLEGVFVIFVFIKEKKVVDDFVEVIVVVFVVFVFNIVLVYKICV